MVKNWGAVTKYLSAPHQVYSVYKTNIIVSFLSVKRNFNIFYSKSQSFLMLCPIHIPSLIWSASIFLR